MINVGKVDAMFSCKAQGMDVCFDPATEEQFLSFRLALQVSLPQLLQQLLEFQRGDGAQQRGPMGPGVGVPSPEAAGVRGPTLTPVSIPLQQPALPPPPNIQEIMQAGLSQTAPTYHALDQHQLVQQQLAQQTQTAPTYHALDQHQLVQQQLAQQTQSAPGYHTLEQHQLVQQQLVQQAQALGRMGMPPVVGAVQHQMARQFVSEQQVVAPAQMMQQQQPPMQPTIQQSLQQALQEPMRLAFNPAEAPWEAKSQMTAVFLDALRTNNMAEARRLLQQRADVNCESGPSRMTPLHAVLESGGHLDAVNLLLKARANVNAAMATGRTPLHSAVQQFPHLSPLVVRMLLCNQADLCLADVNGVTPLDSVRMVSMQASSAEGEARIAVRQLLDEVTELPTIDVGVVDGQVQGAHFADTQNDKVVINTESSIGVYSVLQRRIVFMKKLRQQQVISTVKHISVNAELGTIAVCLEIVEAQPSMPGERGKMQNVFIIWPNGKLQDEEPLKLSINVDPQPQGMALPACAILSRTRGPQLLLSRLVDGKVFSWRLNNGRSQLVSEAELTGNAGIVAASDNGCWIAVAVVSQAGSFVNVYSYESPAGMLQEPRLVVTEPKCPQCMAIQEAGYNIPNGHLALAEAAVEGQPPPPIEISAVSADGTSRILYRLKVPSPCCSLNFCHGVVTHILSGHTDGLSVLYDLKKGLTIQCHGSPATGSRSISADRTMIAATESHCFRIFKVPSAEPGA